MSKVTFEFVAPGSITTTLRSGAEVVFTPLTVREIPAFARAVKPITAMAGPLLNAAFAETGGEQLLAVALVQAAAEHGETFIDAVAIASRMKTAEVGALLLDELVVLAAYAIQVNADFFTRALPAMRLAGDKLQGEMAARASTGSTGPTPSTA